MVEKLKVLGNTTCNLITLFQWK